MAKHECCSCKYMQSLTDENFSVYDFCMYSHSPAFLQEVGCCGECDLDETAEEWYQEW